MDPTPRTPLLPPRPAPARWLAGLAGLCCGALAVTAGMLFAAIGDVASPIDAVGSEVIDRSPRWVKEWAIRTFGTDDKSALRVGIVTVLAAAAVVAGVLAATRRRRGVVGVAVFGIVGALAAVNRPGQGWAAALPSVLGAAIGAAALATVLRPRPMEVPGLSPAPLGWDRRRFLVAGGVTAAGAAAAGLAAQAITTSRDETFRARAARSLPGTTPPPGGAPVATDGAQLDPSTPFITPNDRFYRIDTALSLPRADAASWSLRIDGMVDHPTTLTYADLLSRPQVERTITICCVSNEIGGPYIGTAVWRGVLLADVLRDAGVRPSAEQVFSTSLDGWTCGFPLSAALDGRDALIAVAMNGEPLPLEHGYPARLIVPGLYGYVSATKWLSRIELSGWDRQGYWVPRGWAQQAPVKTQSRIGVPRAGQRLVPGLTKIAGVAWAQHRGISRVEVQIDDEPWRDATLGTDVSEDTWRQWVIDWQASPGQHRIRVRATDGSGVTQTEERTAVAPDGATGWHTIAVDVG